MERENIYQRLEKLRKQVSVIKKTSRGFNYNYTSEADILVNITGLMEKHHISLVPSVVPGTLKVERQHIVKTRFNKQGQMYEDNSDEYKVTADMIYKWIDNDNPSEFIEVPWVMVATMPDGAQALGSALTYSSRYFLLKFFNVANSNDDPDALKAARQRAVQAEEDEINSEILNLVDKEIKDHLTSFPDDRDDIKKIASKYIKGGNYRNIRDSALSSKLLNEVREWIENKKGEN